MLHLMTNLFVHGNVLANRFDSTIGVFLALLFFIRNAKKPVLLSQIEDKALKIKLLCLYLNKMRIKDNGIPAKEQ